MSDEVDVEENEPDLSTVVHMPDKSLLAEQAMLGEEAKSLRDNPVLKRFFAEAERNIVDAWRSSDIHDEAGQRMCRISLRCQQNLRDVFEDYIVNGQISATELLRLNNPTEPTRHPL